MPTVPTLSVPTIAISGSEQRFPVRRIYCVGRNYAEHAREMGHDPKKELPFFFSKPADAVVSGARALPFPPRTAELHHEVELVVALIDGAEHIQREWLDGVQHIGVTAGASAPDELVRGVIARLQSWGAGSVRELDGEAENITFALPKELRMVAG